MHDLVTFCCKAVELPSTHVEDIKWQLNLKLWDITKMKSIKMLKE